MSDRDKPTTVGQLIEALRKFPPDTRVMVGGGYSCREGGYDDWSRAAVCRVELNHYHERYYGPHTDADKDDASAVNAVVLS